MQKADCYNEHFSWTVSIKTANKLSLVFKSKLLFSFIGILATKIESSSMRCVS